LSGNNFKLIIWVKAKMS